MFDSDGDGRAEAWNMVVASCQSGYGTSTEASDSKTPGVKVTPLVGGGGLDLTPRTMMSASPLPALHPKSDGAADFTDDATL